MFDLFPGANGVSVGLDQGDPRPFTRSPDRLPHGHASRRRTIEAEARRLGLSFSRRDPFRVLDSAFHPFVRFGKLPGTQGVENVDWGERAGREVRAFEYWRPAEDESIRYSCAMVRIPEGWPSLLVRRHGPIDAARRVAGLRGQELELETFNRRFEVRSNDRRLASAVVDQRMMGWLLESDPVLGFQLQHGWLLAWMPRLPAQELERALRWPRGSTNGFREPSGRSTVTVHRPARLRARHARKEARSTGGVER